MNFIGDVRSAIGEKKLARQEGYHLGKKWAEKPYLRLRKNDGNHYVPYIKQTIFHKAHEHVFETLYGGAAGGGKSHAMLMDAYMYAISNPGVRLIMFRRTFPQLEKSLIFMSRMMFDGSMGRYREKDKKWVLFTSGVPSYLEFGHCKNEGDVYDYHSAQYDGMYFDELSHFTEFQFTYLLTRLRTNVPGITPFVKCASNPGGIGHAWVRRRWRLWDKTIHFQIYRPDKESEDEMEVPSRCFIPAFVTDNLYIMKNDPGYINRLKSSPYSRQLLDGDWGIFAGQAFPEFDKNKHCCASFQLPPHWERWASIDYGYSRPFSAHWHTRDPESGRIYTYREIYGAGIKEVDQAKRVVGASSVNGVRENIKYFVADPSVFSPRGGGSSIADVWQKNGLTVMRGVRDRVSGKARVHDYLTCAPDGKGWWQIFADKCPNLVRTLPELVLDQSNPEDVNTTQEDHAYDDIRYFFMSIPSIKIRQETEDAPAGLDNVSAREWEWFRKFAKKISSKENGAVGSGINEVQA